MGPEVAAVETRSIPGPDGDVPVRIYTPEGDGPFPILAWYHGGGWVIGDLDSADPTARHLCKGAGCVVVSVDYRLSPETRFPGAVEDCYAATVWAADNAASLGADASRLAVGGDSAGGNLAAAISLMAADRNGPAIVHQLLVYPVTDGTTRPHRTRTTPRGSCWPVAPCSSTGTPTCPATLTRPTRTPRRCRRAAWLVSHPRWLSRLSSTRCGTRARPTAVGCRKRVWRPRSLGIDGMIHGFFGMVGIMDKSGW